MEVQLAGHVCECLFLCHQGFDEFMNLVMDEAEEVYIKTGKKRRQIGEA